MNWLLIYTALSVCDTHITAYAASTPVSWDSGFEQCEKIQALVWVHERDIRQTQLIEHPDDDAKIVTAAAKELGVVTASGAE
jgi:hypothetical protein